MDAQFSTTSSPSPDRLLGGEFPRETQEITVASGENLTAGAVIGRITVGTAAAAAAAGNTGNGTMGAVTTGADAKPGVYKVVIVEPGANVGTFIVEDPDGVIVGRGTVAVAFAGPVNFTLADGATDFVAGDTFNITVAAGSGQWRRSVAAATDGSQRPLAILVGSVDATSGAKKASAYRTGEFNTAALNFGAGHSVSTVRAPLEAVQIYLSTSIPA